MTPNKPAYIITWPDCDDEVVIDATFAKYYEMLLKMESVSPMVETIHGQEYKTVDKFVIHFIFDEDISLPNRQALKDMLYYHAMEKYGVTLVKFSDHKYNPLTPYDFSIEVGLAHVIQVTYKGEVFKPGVINRQIEVGHSDKPVPPNVTIH